MFVERYDKLYGGKQNSVLVGKPGRKCFQSHSIDILSGGESTFYRADNTVLDSRKGIVKILVIEAFIRVK